MFPRKTSVAVIIAIALVVVTTLTLVTLGVVAYHRHNRRDFENVRRSVAVDADQIGPSLVRPIQTSDQVAVEEIAEGMMVDPVLAGVVIKSGDGQKVLCAKDRDSEGRVVDGKGMPQVEESLVERRTIKFDNEPLATVTIFGTTKSLRKKEWENLSWVFYNICWVDPVLFIGTFLLLRLYVFKPLRELETYAARSCTGRKPKPLPAYYGELETVRLSTKAMLAQLEVRNKELMERIAERRRAAEVLREKQAQLFLAMDIARLAYWEFDVEANLVTCDERLFKLFGTTSAEEGGLSLSSEEYIQRFVHPADAAIVANELALAVSTTDPDFTREFEHRFICKDGTEGVMTVRSRVALGSSGRPDEIMGTNQDITEQKKLEQQFLRSQRMESVGVLAGGVAHDLNNSLAPILMAVSLMELQLADPKSQKLVKTVELSARRGVDLVRQLLSFARGVEGRRMPLQVRHLVREIEKLTNDTFLKNIKVETSVLDDVSPVVGDPTQIQQVLLNLCVNARDAMPEGGEIQISAGNVTIDERQAARNSDATPGPYVLLRVSDTGTGISPAAIDKIFDPFFTTKEVGKGTGLGLSTSLAIVKSHGGFIQVRSELGKGTTFEVYLPARTDATTSHAAPADQELLRGNGELVLIVDDEAEVSEMMQETLKFFGYRTIVAPGGDEAAMIFATRHSEIDVVITDMRMPVMDGPETIQVLRNIDPQVRIIPTSGLAATDQVDGVSMKHFLLKPFTTETLLKELRNTLDEPV